MDTIIPTNNNTREYCFQIRGSGGTSGTVEPDWDATSINQEFTDGSVNNWINSGNPTPIAEDKDFFNHNQIFDGTIGMGCGPRVDRPATGTPGVGYWETDQDCTTISNDNVGAHPKTPISGTLYRANADGTWEEYFKPFTYPHPLRTSGPLADKPTPILTPVWLLLLKI